MTNSFEEKVQQQIKIMNQSLEKLKEVLKPIDFPKEIILPSEVN